MDLSNLTSKNEEIENSSTLTNNIVETENSFSMRNNILENLSVTTNNIVDNSSIIINNIAENMLTVINNTANNVDEVVDVDVNTNVNISPIGENVESDDVLGFSPVGNILTTGENVVSDNFIESDVLTFFGENVESDDVLTLSPVVNILPIGENVESDDVLRFSPVVDILPIGENVVSDDFIESDDVLTFFGENVENNVNVLSTLNENMVYQNVTSDDEHYDDEHDVEDHNTHYEGYFNQLPQLFIPANADLTMPYGTVMGTSFFSIPVLENLNNPQELFDMMVNNMLNPVMPTNIVNEINPSNSGNSVLQNTSFTGQPLNLNMNSVGNQGMIEEEVRKLILYGEENLNLVTQPVLDFIESCYLQNMQYDENLINLIHYTVKNVFARNTQFEMKELISGIIVYSLNGINATFSDNYDMVLPILEQEIKSIVTRSLRLAILRRTMAAPPEMEDVKLVVGADALEKIPICKYENLEDKIKKMNISCTVCQEDFNTEDSVRLLPCEHIYHPDCIDDWLKEHSYKCPCCRKPAAEHSAKI